MFRCAALSSPSPNVAGLYDDACGFVEPHPKGKGRQDSTCLAGLNFNFCATYLTY